MGLLSSNGPKAATVEAWNLLFHLALSNPGLHLWLRAFIRLVLSPVGDSLGWGPRSAPIRPLTGDPTRMRG